jgi:hypothetical protein
VILFIALLFILSMVWLAMSRRRPAADRELLIVNDQEQSNMNHAGGQTVYQF